MPCRSRSYFLCSFSTSVLQSSPCLSVHPSIPWHIRTPNDKILKYAHNLYIKREEQYILCDWMTGVVVVLVLVVVVYCALCVFHILSFKEKYFVRGPQFRNFVLSSSFWWIKTAVEQPEKLIRVPLFVCDSSSGGSQQDTQKTLVRKVWLWWISLQGNNGANSDEISLGANKHPRAINPPISGHNLHFYVR